MWKKKENSIGKHVRFTKDDYRPYVTPYDLVTSENFQRILAQAIKEREQQERKAEKSAT